VNKNLTSNDQTELESWKVAADILAYGGFSKSCNEEEGGTPPWQALPELRQSEVATHDCQIPDASLTPVHVAVLAQHYNLLSIVLSSAADDDELLSKNRAASSSSSSSLSSSSSSLSSSLSNKLFLTSNVVGTYRDRKLLPLHEAIRAGWVEGACLLLNRKADPNATETEGGETALSLAAIMARCSCISSLVDNHAKSSSSSSSSSRSSSSEVFQSSHSMFALLLNCKLKVQLEKCDLFGRTPLHFLCAPYGYYGDDVIDIALYNQCKSSSSSLSSSSSNTANGAKEFYDNALVRVELLTMLICNPRHGAKALELIMNAKDVWGLTPFELMKHSEFDFVKSKQCEQPLKEHHLDDVVFKTELRDEDKLWLCVAIQFKKFQNEPRKLKNFMHQNFSRSKASPSDVSEFEHDYNCISLLNDNVLSHRNGCSCSKRNKDNKLSIIKNGSFIISAGFFESNMQNLRDTIDKQLKESKKLYLDDDEDGVPTAAAEEDAVEDESGGIIDDDFVYISHTVEGDRVRVGYDVPANWPCPCTVFQYITQHIYITHMQLHVFRHIYITLTLKEVDLLYFKHFP
jgi:hypothetical protein